jgi:hypothetical protein
MEALVTVDTEWAGGQPTREPAEARCVPLCGAVRAYGDRALEPRSWWKHEALCPMREHLRELLLNADEENDRRFPDAAS